MTERTDRYASPELAAAVVETGARLRDRGVRLTGRETPVELAELLDAVERFEAAVESRGGDLMVDEGPHGTTSQPDDRHFVLPRRRPLETVAAYLERIAVASAALRVHRPHD